MYKEARLRIIDGKNGGTVRVINLCMLRGVYNFYRVNKPLFQAAAFHPQRATEFLFSDIDTHIYRVDVGRQEPPVSIIKSPRTGGLQVSPDGKSHAVVRHVAASKVFEVVVLEYQSLRVLPRFRTRDNGCLMPYGVFSSDSSLFAFPDDELTHLCRIGTKQQWSVRKFLDEPFWGYGSLAFSPDNRCIPGYNTDGEVIFWDVETGNLASRMALANCPGHLVAYLEVQSQRLLLLESGYDIFCFDAKSLKRIWKLPRNDPDTIYLDEVELHSRLYRAADMKSAVSATWDVKNNTETFQPFDILTGKPTGRPIIMPHPSK
ncbi:MAG: WD40 repeat domain-containing protein [Gemmatales bacterium]|nr:WD40 repeat domain-containing protein [Gemmatales bacterium]MDW7994377.1 WD40 repeat domain-containing protein [Gemmatales bacterium]